MEGTHRMKKLQENAKYFRESLDSSKAFHAAGGAASLISPLIHVRLHSSSNDKTTWDAEEFTLQRIVNHCLDRSHVLMTVSKYSKIDSTFRPAPSIKVTVTTEHSKADIDQAIHALQQAHATVIG
jgi:7-keto-8-aminopelargonate synthetase-like enzyme